MKVNMQGGRREKRSFYEKMKRFFKKLWTGTNEVIFPSNIKCLLCGRDLPEKQDIEFCPICVKKLEKISEDKCCKVCGAVLHSSNICLNCKKRKREFDMARSVYVYQDDIQKLIVGMKYNNKPYISRTLGKVLANKFKELNWKVDVVIPVPLTKKRYKSRGYNQAELLAKEFVAWNKLDLSTDILYKVKDTKQQAKLHFQERQNNLKKTFKIINSDAIKDKNILLIDDVFTTGATANACSLSLKEAGANKVYVLCVASTRPEIPTS